MIAPNEVLVGRDALLAATGHHPYARHVLGRGQEARGWRRDGAVGWLLPQGQWSAGGSLGPTGAALDVFAGLLAAGTLRPGQSVNVPRCTPEEVAGRLPVARLDHWDFLWTGTAPPPQAGEKRVVRLTEADHPALDALIERAFPTSASRPDDTGIVDWYGIRDGDRLVACGADRSRGDVGFLSGLTVAPERRGRGLGAALTAGMTKALLARHDLVALGVYTDNVGAGRLYRRLGFTGTAPRSSVHLG
ncbi:GNAT family N-acetyltransferase [Micromonospora okii]|uniref:GNAT family N-acetyltransferase n=1 Tax=Micromonospora okii TaxID=1182970 RepID=UPI001E4E5068|nr:GNAT family N-acetyltransferase [Micromonospora okii]